MNNGLFAILFGIAAIAGGAGWYSWYQNNQQNLEKQGKIEQLDRETATYRDKISDLEQQLQQLTAKTRSIAAAQTPIPAAIEDQKRIAGLLQEVETLKSQDAARVKEFEQFKQAQEKTAADLAAQVDAEKRKYQDEKQALEKTIADLTAEHTRLQAQLNNHPAVLTPIPETSDQIAKQRQQAEDAVQKKDQELLALQQAKAALEKTNMEQGTTIQQLTQKLDETAAATQTDAASKTQEIAALQAKLHAAEQQNVDLKTQSDAAIAALQTETQALAAKLSQAESELAALRQAKEQAETQANTAETTIAKLQQEAQQMAGTLNDVQNKLAVSEENLAAREAEYQAKIAEHNQMITKLKEDIENGVVEKDSIQKRLQDEVDKSKSDYQKRLEELAAAKEQEIEKLRTMAETYQTLSKNLEKEISEKTVTIEQIKEKLSVKIVDKILFATGKAEINANGIRLLKTVGDSLKTSLDGRQIRIEGHTDNRPIVSGITAKYPTNWELSTARAVNVVKYLEQAAKIEPRKLEAVGYGPYRPIADNATEEGRALNRRIEIILTPELERETVQ